MLEPRYGMGWDVMGWVRSGLCDDTTFRVTPCDVDELCRAFDSTAILPSIYRHEDTQG